MRYCESCKVQVNGNHETCPLCGMLLTQETTEKTKESYETFPYVPTIYRKFAIVFKILAFLSVVTVVVCISIDLMIKDYQWSFFVLAGIICFWISFYVAYSKRKNIPKNLLYQVVILSIIFTLWDYFTGWKGWSIDIAIPCLCLSDLLVLYIISKILHSDVEDYMIYLLIGGIFGIVPMLFYATGCLTIVLPSILCTASSIIFLSAVAIFQGAKITEELKRRLHY